jgi:hypothetical protein
LRGGKVTNHLTGGNTVNTIRALPCRIRTALAPKGRRIALCVRAKTIIKTHIGRVTAHYMRATAHGECLIDVACRVEWSLDDSGCAWWFGGHVTCLRENYCGQTEDAEHRKEWRYWWNHFTHLVFEFVRVEIRKKPNSWKIRFWAMTDDPSFNEKKCCWSSEAVLLWLRRNEQPKYLLFWA